MKTQTPVKPKNIKTSAVIQSTNQKAELQKTNLSKQVVEKPQSIHMKKFDVFIEGIALKEIFDHLRNIGLLYAALGVGWFVSHGLIPYADYKVLTYALGIAIIVVGVLLAFLNVLRAYYFVKKTTNTIIAWVFLISYGILVAPIIVAPLFTDFLKKIN